ncbi:MAG TPA: HD domain-containing protein [Thermohalobaculum sp.]|nr:HD domain-containing protein [Thermohalobaculum sp.]
MAAPEDIVLLARAFHYACKCHSAHRRKGAEAEPYVNHLADVARRVAEATGGRDVNLIAAALLHDTVEDVGVTADDLVAVFGADIAALVLEVTDDSGLARVERKRQQVMKAPGISARARMLKLADKASNLRAIVASPPDWPAARKFEYADWAEQVAAGLRGVNEQLERELDAAIAALRDQHG